MLSIFSQTLKPFMLFRTPATTSETRHLYFISPADWIYGWLCALPGTVMLFFAPILRGEALLSRDMLRVYLPIRTYWRDRVLLGEFPEWFPYDAFGQALPGDVVAHVFHPTNLLQLILKPIDALTVSTALAFFFAAQGLYLCVRSFHMQRSASVFVASIAPFSGYMVSMTDNLSYLLSTATLPWAFCASLWYLRHPSVAPARLFLASLVLAILAFSGDPETFVLACAIIMFSALFFLPPTHSVPRLLILFIFTFFLSSIQILPAFVVRDLAGIAERSFAEQTLWSLHPLRLISFFFGPIFSTYSPSPSFETYLSALGNNGDRGLWATNVTLGPILSLLAILSPFTFPKTRERVFVVVLLIAPLLLALGRHTPLYRAAYQALPLWSSFRYPEKIVGLTSILFSIAAARTVDVFMRVRRVPRSFLAIFLLCAVVALPFFERGISMEACASLLRTVGISHDYTEHILPAVCNALIECARWTAFLCLSGFLVFRLLRTAILRSVLITTLGLTYSLYIGSAVISFSTKETLRTNPSTIATLLRQPDAPALGRLHVLADTRGFLIPSLSMLRDDELYGGAILASLSSSANALYKIENASMYLPSASARLRRLRHAYPKDWLPFLGRLFNIGFVVLGPDLDQYPDWLWSFEIVRHPFFHLSIIRLPSPFPRAYLAQPLCVPNISSAISKIANLRPLSNSIKFAIVECARSEPHTATDASGNTSIAGSVTIRTYQPEFVELDVLAERDAVLVINDAFYPGWEATVDDRPAPILPANVIVRAIPVSRGHHVVRMRYRTPYLRLGAVLAFLALAVLLLWSLGRYARSRLRKARLPKSTIAAP